MMIIGHVCSEKAQFSPCICIFEPLLINVKIIGTWLVKGERANSLFSLYECEDKLICLDTLNRKWIFFICSK